MAVGADDGAIQHQPFKVGVSTQFLEQSVDHTVLQPSVIPPFDRLKSAEFRRADLSIAPQSAPSKSAH